MTPDPDPLALAEEAEALCAKANDGPWEIELGEDGVRGVCVVGSHRAIIFDDMEEVDARLVARSRTLLPALAAAVRSTVAERNEALAALAEIHRIGGRDDGHGSPRDTAACVISALIDAGAMVSETEHERDDQRARLAVWEPVVRAAMIFAHGCANTWDAEKIAGAVRALPEEHKP